ncbi:ATP-binding protein [Cecembia rubra]|uniref:Adenylate kinase n=1 Tax=Cecembia rubra TaxID=1485585 RepID=A0A2P8DVG1_9BACT|nr:ATP-binding protein [Cecembia rubra]PSL01228.1 adenylate kinase [Cecembia rubra]
MKNIIFIGGIHGVGKGTLCRKVCNDLNLRHLSASEVLKWEEISEKENKLVKDFTLTQNRLITNLQQIVTENERYVLDGHYCLLNKDNVPEKIDFDTFRALNPFAFIIVVDDVQEIKKRLENRDNREYDFDLLLKFQELELEYSIELAEQLNKPHLTLKSEETNNFKTFLYDENFTRH